MIPKHLSFMIPMLLAMNTSLIVPQSSLAGKIGEDDKGADVKKTVTTTRKGNQAIEMPAIAPNAATLDMRQARASLIVAMRRQARASLIVAMRRQASASLTSALIKGNSEEIEIFADIADAFLSTEDMMDAD